MRFPLLSKALAVGAVLLVLSVGLDRVAELVAEREGRLREAERSVAEALAAGQTLVGPVLQRRCVEEYEVREGEGPERALVTKRREFTLQALPASVQMQASTRTEPRYRGIFKVNGYALNLELDSRWQIGQALTPVARHAGGSLRCEATVVAMAVGDARGIRAAALKVDGAATAVAGGSRLRAHPRGFHAVLPAAAAEAGPARIELTLDLVGTGQLLVAPAAQETSLSLASDWPHPSFTGRFLPMQREVSPAGFRAEWRLSALATTAPDSLLAGSPLCESAPMPAAGAAQATDPVRCIESFGVDFIDPVSVYRLGDRAIKYGLLFVVLTFATVGLTEVLRALRVHPVQYLFVGSALVVFFLLLLGLSEHLPFAWAYTLAAGACTVLLGFYGSFVLGGGRAGLAFGAGIGLLYGVLYLLLQLEQNALLLGSWLLFSALGGVMVLTRRIDWYALTQQLRRQGPGQPDSAG